tara:strand:- start:1621 stop:2178 length:558 start_codon:yes stop_codon:yes gene_type:complete
MKPRVKRYLLFMFGNWNVIEKDSAIMQNIREVMESIVNSSEFSFVTGDNVIIMCLHSEITFEEVSGILEEFLKPHISTYFLMPKPRKLSYRLDNNLEAHLFGKVPPLNKLNIPPRVVDELTQQLRSLMNRKIYKLKEEALTPQERNQNNLLRPMTVDGVLDKIIDEGMDSLTPEELDFLKKYNNT